MGEQAPPSDEKDKVGMARASGEWGVRIRIAEDATHVIAAADLADAVRIYGQWPKAERALVRRLIGPWEQVTSPGDPT